MSVEMAFTIVGFALAAAVGTALRFAIGRRLNGDFPLGTLLVNLLASLALGIIVSADEPLSIVVGIGAIGAMSTWSAAANEAAEMARDDNGTMALGYLGLSISAGVLAAWFGLKLGALIFG